MTLDRSQLEQALERATRLEGEREQQAGFGLADVERVGDELGLSRETVRRAVADVSGEASGMLTVGVRRIVQSDADTVQEDLTTYLHLRGLEASGPGLWRQRGGWWPDLYRLSAVTPVAVTVSQAGEQSFVSLTAGIDRVFRAHIVAAFVGMLAAVLIFLSRPGPGQLLALTGLLVIWLAADLWAFMRRRLAIQHRLAGALADVARPSYRHQPW